MARFTQSPLTPNLSGKIGGMSISSSQSGKILKVSARPRKYNSLQSNKAKLSLDYILNNWRTLSQAARDEWEAYSVFRPVEQKNNPGRYINGQQYYIRYNTALYAQFAVLQNAVAFVTDTPFAATLSLERAGGDFLLNSDVAIDENTDFVIIKISAPMPPSRKTPNGGTKQIIVNFMNSISVSIAADYTTLFGALPVAGDTCYVDYTFYKNGTIQWTAPTRVKLIVQ